MTLPSSKLILLFLCVPFSFSCKKNGLKEIGSDLSTVTFGKIKDDKYASLKIEVREKDSNKVVMDETIKKGESSSKKFKKGWYKFSMTVYDSSQSILYKSSYCSTSEQESNTKNLTKSKETISIKVCDKDKKKVDEESESTEVNIDVDIIKSSNGDQIYKKIDLGLYKDPKDSYFGNSLYLNDSHVTKGEDNLIKTEAYISKHSDKEHENYNCKAIWRFQVIESNQSHHGFVKITDKNNTTVPGTFTSSASKKDIENVFGKKDLWYSGAVYISMSCG